MRPDDHKRILDFYENALAIYGVRDSRSVHWADEQTQIIRFEVLNKIANLNNKKILDVGCGLGDLYMFFIRKKINVDYTGIDIVPEFIERAKERFPDAKLILGNAETISDEYDFILASGAFTFAVENAKEYYFAMIKNLFEHTREGLAFNMLNVESHQSDDTYITYDISEVEAFCKTLTPNVNVVVVDDYLPWDFTIYMYKN